MFHTREHVGDGVFRSTAWLLFAMMGITSTGCGTWNKVRERAAEDGRQMKAALAPLADPYGGSLSSRGGEIEHNLAKTGTTLP